jgi:1,2-phenylacetyl-CoA epoxidase catalytic subunit
MTDRSFGMIGRSINLQGVTIMEGIPENMTPKYKEMAIRLLTRQLWTEHATMDIFGRAIGLAPTWKDEIRTSRFTKEEGTHTRICADVLEALGVDVDESLRIRGESDAYFDIKTGGMTSWVEVTAFNMIGDRAGSRQITAYENNSLPAWGSKLTGLLEEEAGHQAYGDAMAVKLCNESEENRLQMQGFVDVFLPRDVKVSFGRLDARANEYCLEVGLKTKDAAQLQWEYFESLFRVFEEAKLKFPNFESAGCELAPKVKKDFGLH